MRQGNDVIETSPNQPVFSEEFGMYMMPETTVTTLREPFRMDDKTPFVRMWTGVKIIEPAFVVDITKEEVENDPDLNYDLQLNDGSYDVNIEKFPTWIDTGFLGLSGGRIKDKLEAKYGVDMVVPVKEAGTKDIIGYAIKKRMEQKNFVRKIYEIGNHNYQENYGEVKVNDSIGGRLTLLADAGDSSEELGQAGKILPPELNNNKFMKPQSGITAVTSETEGALGVIKKTTVSFTVNNFEDYDKIFNKYFLKPGATVFVDFGWGNIPYLYKPEDLLDNSTNIQEFLYGQRANTESILSFELLRRKRSGVWRRTRQGKL